MFSKRLKKGILAAVIAGTVAVAGCGGELGSPASKEDHAVDLQDDFRLRTISKPEKNYIYGEITKDTVLTIDKSPYYVIKPLIVKKDVLLTIEPGVVMKFDAYTPLIVEGNLHAIGKEDKRIVFTFSGIGGVDWDGIRLVDSAFDYASKDLIEGYGCIIKYAKISQARTGIACIETSPLIEKNVFINNDEGIRCWQFSNAVITGNYFEDNITGVDCMNYSSPVITNNTIIGLEGKGIRCLNYCSPLIENNTIFGKGTTWWKGIIVVSSSHPVIRNNNIYANGGYNIYLSKRKPGDKSPNLDAKNNWWGVSDKEVIAARINDKMDQAVLGIVEYSPYEKNKIKEAKAKL